MLTGLHEKKNLQLVLGLLIGIVFGFLLQKGGVTDYNVIIGQLLLTDFTVVKIMLAASITGMLGVHLLRSLGLAQLHPKPGSFGASVIGGLLFGIGFGILGYCPGTVAGAVGEGALDALFGGVIGMLIGAGVFAALYPKLQQTILSKGDFGELTLPTLFKVNAWLLVIPVATALIALLWLMERFGL
jgi:uncharacterized membrane protein YedE/YeeE